MPSFDIVSGVDKHELQNATDQANKEISARFDFKGSDSRFENKIDSVLMVTESDFQLDQMYDVLIAKMTKRSIDILCLERKDADLQLKVARQEVLVRQGVGADLARKIVKMIKASKIKVQAAVQGDSVRVSGKKRDDLQQVMALLRAETDLDMPLQFNNFRD